MRKKILIVEDNPVNIDIFEEILEEGYELLTALNGEEALKVINEFNPDAVLLDVMMPGIDGYEVCRRIREKPDFRSTGIVMVSARAMDSERARGMAAGANAYVTKPFDEDELLGVINQLFS